MEQVRPTRRLLWLVAGCAMGLFCFLSAIGAALCLASGSVLGFVMGIGWTVACFWFFRGMIDRARPA
jgi:hypothetical protein